MTDTEQKILAIMDSRHLDVTIECQCFSSGKTFRVAAYNPAVEYDDTEADTLGEALDEMTRTIQAGPIGQ